MTARHRSRAPRTARRAAPLVAVALTVLVVVGLGLPSGATATEAAPDGSAAADLLPSIEDLTPWVPVDGEFAVRVQMPPDHPGGVLLGRVYRPMEDGDEVRHVDDPTRRTRWATYEQEVPEGAASVTLRVPTGEARDDDLVHRLDLDPGVYPVALELLLDDGESWEAVTYLVQLPVDTPRSDVALVVPVSAPLQWGPAEGVSISPADVDAIGALTATLAAYPEVPVTLALEPAVATALGNVAGGGAVRDQLALIGRRGAVLNAPYVEVAAGSWAGGVLSPELVDQFDAGAAALTNLLGRPPDGSTWVVDAGDSPALLSWLSARNVTRFLLTPHVPGGGLAGGDTPLRLEGLEAGHRAYAGAAVDAPLAATGADPLLQANHLLAALAADALEGPVQPKVLFAAGPAGGDLETLALLLRALGENGPFEPTTASALPTSAPAPVVVPRPPAPSDDLTELSRDLGQLRARSRSFASTAGEGDPALADLRRAVLVAGRSNLTHEARVGLLVEVESTMREGLAGIELVDSGALTVTSHRARLPVTIRNTSARALDIAVTAESAQLAMLGGPARLTLLPGATEDIEIPFRLSRSGDFVVEVTVATPDGGFVLATEAVTLRSTAVSGLGVVLSVGALVFLGAWWGRNLRHRRRESPRTVATTTATAPDTRVSEPVP